MMKLWPCDECGGKIAKKEVEFSLDGVSLGMFEALVCQKCGQQLFDERASDLIAVAAKKKGLWGTERNKTLAVSH